MSLRNLFGHLKDGGYKIIVFYFSLNLLLSISSYLVPGSHVSLKLISVTANISLAEILLIVINFVVFLFTMAGAIGSYNDLLNDQIITFKSVIKNGSKYFFRTFVYSLVYRILVGFMAVIPLTAYVLLLRQTGNVTELLNNPAMEIFLGIGFQALAMPYIVLNVLSKSTKGYLGENYKFLLVFGIVATLIAYIPLAGRYLAILITCIYYLLILTQCDNSC